MRIEVAAHLDDKAAKKTKGDLLEDFAYELASSRGLSVEKEVRTASSEIDLLCVDDSTGEKIYLECKAHRGNLSKTALTNLVGVVAGEDYAQGWLVSTGPLSKDAKGYRENWSKKPIDQRRKLKVDSEDGLVQALISANLVKNPIGNPMPDELLPGHTKTDWLLLVTEYGRFWTSAKFEGGIAAEVYAYDAGNLSPIDDQGLLDKLSNTDCSWEGKKFTCREQRKDNDVLRQQQVTPPVIEILEGKKWSDYLPARRQDFTGRKKETSLILSLLAAAANSSKDYRVFALTGESGIGKSSLITSTRGKTRQKNYKNKFFTIAIDCRAAKSKDYISAALVRCLKKASVAGFGDKIDNELFVSNPSHPLSSATISDYLSTVKAAGQSICIVFDQFEEIYSKPELEEVFKAAQDLFLSAVSEEGPLVLGFSWRSNFTVQQDHSAYFLWHNLAEYRLEISLKPLESFEVNASLTVFEKELGQKLRPETRKQLVEAARGYPWLLKKLCLHLLKQVKGNEVDQALLEDTSIENLFAEDLHTLSEPEKKALKYIAERAPIARFEAEEQFGSDAIKSLEDRLLVMRSGEMLNIYWDIFKEFILHGVVPELPFSFLPSSPSVASLLSVANELEVGKGKSLEDISVATQLAVGTVGNIVRDLLIVDVASGAYSEPRLNNAMSPKDPKGTMRRVRSALSRHTLLRQLKADRETRDFSEKEISEVLSEIPSVPEYGSSTLNIHVKRLCVWFAAAGFLQATPKGWLLEDTGDVDLSYAEQGRRGRTGFFYGNSPPARAYEVLEFVKQKDTVDPSKINEAGYDAAFIDLSRLGLVVKLEKSWSYVQEEGNEVGISTLERLYIAAKKQAALVRAAGLLRETENTTGPELARHLAKDNKENWSESSLKRIGNSVKRWATWIIECDDAGLAIEPTEGKRGMKSLKSADKIAKIAELRSEGIGWKAISEEIGVTPVTAKRWWESEQR